MAIIRSSAWLNHVITHHDQTCGDLHLSKTNSSLIECAIQCMAQMSCYMFEFFILTEVCDVFTGIAQSDTSTAAFSIPRVVHKGTTSTHIADSDCQRSGYTFDEIGNLCLKYMDGIEAYDDAQRKCETDNGRLLVLTTAQQIKGAQQYLNSKGINRVLVGMTDRVTEGLWMWSDGTPFDSTMWSGLSLNNYDSAYLKEIKNADCVTLKSHSLYDVHCNTTQPFMCERPQLV